MIKFLKKLFKVNSLKFYEELEITPEPEPERKKYVKLTDDQRIDLALYYETHTIFETAEHYKVSEPVVTRVFKEVQDISKTEYLAKQQAK